jgi:LacI family transcriptional regulator
MAVTLQQIAQKARVSEMTVSNILNGRYIPVQKRAMARATRIKRIAEELGYLPNVAAQATATGRFKCISLLLSTSDGVSTISGGMLRGMQDGLMPQGVHLNVSMLPDEQLIATWGVPHALRQQMCDGFLINYTHRIPQQLVERIRQYHLPSVWINSKQEADCVYPDDFGAGLRLTRHLLSMGHRRIAYIDLSHSPEFEQHYSAIDRRAGYEQAMREAALPTQLICPEDQSRSQSRVEAVRAAMSAIDRPTALIGYSVTNIMLINTALLSMGLRIPQDVSVATFDQRVHDTIGLPITTALSADQAVGAAAVSMLLKKIEDPARRLPPRVVPFDLDPGQTCVRPGA